MVYDKYNDDNQAHDPGTEENKHVAGLVLVYAATLDKINVVPLPGTDSTAISY